MMMKNPITTHVLDTSRGRPASGLEITLEKHAGAEWHTVGRGKTNQDGRLADLVPADSVLKSGTYRLTFMTAEYFNSSKISSFYPQVSVTFIFDETEGHYHIPLLLSPFGYSTYRGS